MVLKNLFTGQQWRNRHRKQTYGHGDRGGEGEMYGKSNMETYISIRKIDSLEGWDGEGDEREVQKGGNICIPMADSC